MIIYFCLYSFIGYLMESCYISLFKKRFVSSGLLKGPYIPLYGIGGIILIGLSPYLKQSIILCLFVGGLSMTILEYITSLYIEKVFHTKCWNYSHHIGNFQGRICIGYYLMWSCLSLLFIIYIHPFISLYIPRNIFTLLISLLIILFIIKDTINKLNKKRKILLIGKESSI